MEAFLASFLVVFLAELGDKTQFIVMAFTAKYRWQSVFAGMTLGHLRRPLARCCGGIACGAIGSRSSHDRHRFMPVHRLWHLDAAR